MQHRRTRARRSRRIGARRRRRSPRTWSRWRSSGRSPAASRRIGLGGRNSADLAVRLRNADADAKYEYEMVVLDDECKPNIGVQVATKAAADSDVVAGVTHYCSAVAIGTVDTYHKFGLPVIVWGAVLPDITYGNDYPEIHRVNGTMINQNDTAADFMTGLGYKTWVVIHDTTDYGKGHNKYFSQYVTENGGEILGDLRRHRRAAGLHRGADPGEVAEPRGDLLRRADPARGAHPPADGQARDRRAAAGHLGHHVGCVHRGSRRSRRGRGGVSRGRAGRQAAGRPVLRRAVRAGRLRRAARGLRPVRVRRR